jgi:hypothetical protein
MPHKPPELLLAALQEATEKHKDQIEPGVYYHWKDPSKRYVVTGLSYYEPTEKIVVDYHPYEFPELVWHRPLFGEDGWMTPVEEREGEDKRRFIRINNDPPASC